MIFTASTLPELISQLEVAFAQAPGEPQPVYACAKADLPSAAAYQNCVVFITDLNILAHSDGSNWKREDTGATA